MKVDGTDGLGSDDGGSEVVDRRRLVLGGLASVAGAGGLAAAARPAAAANGGPVILGAANTASATTKVTTTVGNGLQGKTTAAGVGVFGRNTNTTTGGMGVQGKTVKGTGVRGDCDDPSGYGVDGVNYGSTGSAVGVRGVSINGIGVSGSGETYGVYALSSGGTGVYADGANTGVYATGINWAGYFDGKVTVVGTLEKPGGSFRIDHPLDPANKFLSHSFVESPDMMNIYNGVVVLDGGGRATVQVPDWFEALNRDFRYQLTAVGSAAPNLHVSSEIKDRSFTIAGGDKGQKVSWQVTGIRQDAWANANRIPVEEDKTSTERGKYLHPELAKVGDGKPLFDPPKSSTRLDVTVG